MRYTKMLAKTIWLRRKDVAVVHSPTARRMDHGQITSGVFGMGVDNDFYAQCYILAPPGMPRVCIHGPSKLPCSSSAELVVALVKSQFHVVCPPVVSAMFCCRIRMDVWRRRKEQHLMRSSKRIEVSMNGRWKQA